MDLCREVGEEQAYQMLRVVGEEAKRQTPIDMIARGAEQHRSRRHEVLFVAGGRIRLEHFRRNISGNGSGIGTVCSCPGEIPFGFPIEP